MGSFWFDGQSMAALVERYTYNLMILMAYSGLHTARGLLQEVRRWETINSIWNALFNSICSLFVRLITDVLESELLAEFHAAMCRNRTGLVVVTIGWQYTLALNSR